MRIPPPIKRANMPKVSLELSLAKVTASKDYVKENKPILPTIKILAQNSLYQKRIIRHRLESMQTAALS